MEAAESRRPVPHRPRNPAPRHRAGEPTCGACVIHACSCMLAAMLLRILSLLAVLSSLLQADNAALDAWLKRQATVKTLETEFVQERKLPSLKQPVSTPGKLSFANPGRVRWQLGEPVATLVLSDGTTLTLIDHKVKTARRIPADSPQAARFSMLTGDGFQNPENFHAMFEIAAHRVASGIHQYTLKPKDHRMRSQVPWIFLDIDPAKNELRAMELELKDKSRIRTVFQNPRINTKLPPALFEADLTGLTVNDGR
ncbi:MAG: outer membrane lipoprotein carrier protein LolA [Verrucomicrobiaceae bacterium]|nr:MAG: outer membrane lipoprotein carrier protein LolA [Verrucomicrobiaceae bacterium]